MSFWNTFVKVWQVRTAIKIQESFEESFRSSRRNAETEANIPKIVDELIEKNRSWADKMNYHRGKTGK